VKFVFDECVSPALVGIAHEFGYEATSVRDRGGLRMSDRELGLLAETEDRIIVTNTAYSVAVGCIPG
jgi:predicted nuclease of predicted toxin-antitoxin system